MADPQIVMQARGLVKRYGQVTALDGADFELRAGEILAVIGDNGAGKSSLIKALSGATIPDEGEIRCTFATRWRPAGRASSAATRTWRWPRR
jgi:fructose transport system ATP-binding protein